MNFYIRRRGKIIMIGTRYSAGKKKGGKILNEKYIDGKSFMDLIKQVHVEKIFYKLPIF